MACFLIDYENECGRPIEGISLVKLTGKDEVIIFYSKNATRITMELHRELERTKAKKDYIKVETGSPNALDFQLSSYLGACIKENPEKKYYIVSRDKGYESVCSFWKNNGICVERINGFSYYPDISKRTAVD
ncbi:MAG: PIN domain-containing protein [Eubacterium sp.]